MKPTNAINPSTATERDLVETIANAFDTLSPFSPKRKLAFIKNSPLAAAEMDLGAKVASNELAARKGHAPAYVSLY